MYIMGIEESYPDSCWLSYDESKNFDQILLRSCTQIDKSLVPLLSFEANKKISLKKLEEYDYLYSSGPDLVSKKFTNVMQKYIDNGDIQIFPAKISNDTYELLEFSVVHYVRCSDAIDFSKSSHEPLLNYMPEGPANFTHIVLNNTKPEFNIFRASESMGLIIVSEEVRSILEKEKIKGIEFHKELINL